MRTFIWAADWLDFTSEEMFVAQADNVDDARRLVKNQLQCTLDSRIKDLDEVKANGVIGNGDYERCVESAKRDFANVIVCIYRYEPSHIISGGMAARIQHSNQ